MVSPRSKRLSRWSRLAAQQFPQRRHGVDDAALRDLEHHRFGPVDDLGHVLGKAEAELGDLPRHHHEPPQQRVLLHDVRVVRRVRRRRSVHLERDQHRRVADGVEQSRPAELVGNSHRVGGLAPV